MLRQEGQLYILDLGDGENRFTVEWMKEVDAALVAVAEAEGPRSLVTVATGKFWSNGLDLDWMLAHPDDLPGYVAAYRELLAKLLTLPVQSVAVIQGHCYAGGALFALAHDVRMMRQDRGFFCLPEVAIGIPFAPGMSSLIREKLPPQTSHEAMTQGARYGGDDALAAGIVQASVAESELADLGRTRAEGLADVAGATLRRIRTEMFRSTIEKLRTPQGLDLPEQ